MTQAAWQVVRVVWLMWALLCGAQISALAQVCGAAGGDNRAQGAPCPGGSQEDPASPSGDAPVSATRASIDLVTGNKYLRDADASWPDGLVLIRHYNSRNAFSRTLGTGWSHSWDTQLFRRSETELQVIQGDGRRRVFTRAADSAQAAAAAHRRVKRTELEAVAAAPGVKTPTAPGVETPTATATYRSVDPLAGRIVEHLSAETPTRFDWRLPDGRVMRFDAQGRLQSLAQPGVKRIDLDYQPGSNRLRRIRNGHGVVIELGYDARGRLAWLTHPDGRQTRYSYQAQGLLARVQAADGSSVRYEYEAQSLLHGLTSIIDDQGAPIGEFAYDDQGRAVASRLARQSQLTVAYRVPQRAGEPGESIVAHERDGVTRYRWRYLAHAHRAMMLEAVGPGCVVCPPAGVSRQYDAGARLVRETWAASGLDLQWQRDASGRVLRLSSRWPARDGLPALVRHQRFEYQSDEIDAPLAAIVESSVAPGRERRESWQYDAQGRLASHTMSGYTPDLQSLDAQLEPRRWHRVERTTRNGYEDRGPARGRLAWVDGPLPGEIDRTRFRHDELGRLVEIQLPQGLRETREHDAQGRLVSWRDADGLLTRVSYGADSAPTRMERGGIVSQWTPDGGGSRWLTIQGLIALGVHHDAAGRVEAFTDAGGQRWPTPVVPAAAAAAAALPQRPLRGRIESTDPLGARAIRWHDDFAQVVAESGPQRGVTLSRFDAAGRLVLRTHESGTIETFTHDALGRLLHRGSPANPRSVQYAYEGTRLSSVSDPAQTIAYRHDAQGRTIAEAVLIGARDAGAAVAPNALRAMVTLTRRDALGRMLAQRLPGGHALGVARDVHGNPSAIALHSADGRQVLLADGIAWQPNAAGPAVALVGYRAGNGMQVSFGRDGKGRVNELSATRQGSVLTRQTLRYDENGRIVERQQDAERAAFTYDDAGRLTGAADSSGAEGFAYDRNGNRLVRVAWAAGARTVQGGAQGGALAAANAVERYRYDRDGRLLSIASPDDATVTRLMGRTVAGDLGIDVGTAPPPARASTSAGDAWQQARLRGVIKGPHGRAIAAFADQRLLAVYDYNAQGLRVRRAVGHADEQAELYLHQDGLLAGVADHRGQLRRWIVRLGQWPLAELRFENGRLESVHWLMADHRGAPLRALDDRGDTVWQARLLAFGQALPGASSKPESDPGLRLAGQWFDPETGRHENGWRSYIPEQGRYAQPDPLGASIGGNERSFAGSDPIGRGDPFGLYEVDVHYYLTYFLARAAGVSPQRSYTVALAAQYVDDNPSTRPETVGNFKARALYHFVMAGFDTTGDATVRYFNPSSPQLGNLYRASRNPALSDCASVLLLGEYLHTFEDTFSHRDSNNVPFGPFQGHLRAGHDPDQTYDVINSAAPQGSTLRQYLDYPWNDERSMRMAQETYGVLQQSFGTQPVASFAAIDSVVKAFMKTGADQYAAWIATATRAETDAEYTRRKARELRDKIAVLDAALSRMGLGTFGALYADAKGETYQAVYSSAQGASNRQTYLAGLRHGPTQATDPFRGVLLPGD